MSPVHVSRIGLAALKGTRHLSLPGVELTADGPVGDRVFCLVDPVTRRVLRTVENPGLVQARARWHDGVLEVRLPGRVGPLLGEPTPTGETVTADYWGRETRLEVVGGPWARAFSDLLDHDVVLARASRPGEVVFGASVSLVTTSSLQRLREELDGPAPDEDGAAFRATLTLDTDGQPPHVEDTWVGRRVTVGTAEVEVRGVVPRCAVVDRHPLSGARHAPVLTALGRYRRSAVDLGFGVDAVVTRPGRVELLDPVHVTCVPATVGRG